jgi:hypothetical protein
MFQRGSHLCILSVEMMWLGIAYKGTAIVDDIKQHFY